MGKSERREYNIPQALNFLSIYVEIINKISEHRNFNISNLAAGEICCAAQQRIKYPSIITFLPQFLFSEFPFFFSANIIKNQERRTNF